MSGNHPIVCQVLRFSPFERLLMKLKIIARKHLATSIKLSSGVFDSFEVSAVLGAISETALELTNFREIVPKHERSKTFCECFAHGS